MAVHRLVPVRVAVAEWYERNGFRIALQHAVSIFRQHDPRDIWPHIVRHEKVRAFVRARRTPRKPQYQSPRADL